MNLSLHLQRTALRKPEAPAVALGDSVLLTYEALAERAARLATALPETYSLSPGDRVAVITPNCPEYLELLYGIWHAGLIAVPVNAKLHQKEYAHILSDVDASLVFVSESLHGLVAACAPASCPLSVIGSPDYAALFDAPTSAITDRASEDIAWIFYTSGTTGLPKGACLTHRNLLTMCHCYRADVDPSPPWRAILHAAPMSHGSGLYGLAYVMEGGVHVIPASGGFD
ncbi:MAG: class I adenylate-forming enzyme family protein, partial [Pseudomonadota bacterium]